ncbi:hypothetical protein LEP1GSC193_4009 [Leptospira alstonii serovar Pingchang str. 80-412]|uniref:Uncharacterized protein n=2 Tax=Leptospira alstonii TaxID=28452 RepID=M6CYV0_9LEPT|nr:hypothetical protein LEP1GSC194_0285 [Leptospira alstonii serovar Sichuan str. 79601]EQA81577.1 hypothetical protein LEP1GSC193_4009 [Leptospira alstonii serovar Pingchang str. 80-412]
MGLGSDALDLAKRSVILRILVMEKLSLRLNRKNFEFDGGIRFFFASA